MAACLILGSLQYSKITINPCCFVFVRRTRRLGGLLNYYLTTEALDKVWTLSSMDSDRVILNSRVNKESSFDAHIGRYGWSSTGRPNLGA